MPPHLDHLLIGGGLAVGHPRTTWLRTIDDDLQSLNFRVHTACRKTRDRDVWHQVVSTATLHSEFANKGREPESFPAGTPGNSVPKVIDRGNNI